MGVVLAVLAILTAIAVAFVLACLDPIWGRRTSLRDGMDAILKKDEATHD